MLLPWFRNRKKLILSSLIDIFIILNLHNFLLIKNEGFPTRLLFLGSFILWILISYIYGRYASIDESITTKGKILFFVRTFISIIIINLFLLFIKLINDNFYSFSINLDLLKLSTFI